MFYTILDKKLLSAMIRSQSDLQSYVLIEARSQTVYHAAGWESHYVNAALESGEKEALSLKPYEINLALENLIQLGFVERASGGPAYRVTYRGWYERSVRRHEAFSTLLRNLLLPFLVSVISAAATTGILQFISSINTSPPMP